MESARSIQSFVSSKHTFPKALVKDLWRLIRPVIGQILSIFSKIFSEEVREYL